MRLTIVHICRNAPCSTPLSSHDPFGPGVVVVWKDPQTQYEQSKNP